jgi:hypothetical protein
MMPGYSLTHLLASAGLVAMTVVSCSSEGSDSTATMSAGGGATSEAGARQTQPVRAGAGGELATGVAGEGSDPASAGSSSGNDSVGAVGSCKWPTINRIDYCIEYDEGNTTSRQDIEDSCTVKGLSILSDGPCPAGSTELDDSTRLGCCVHAEKHEKLCYYAAISWTSTFSKQCADDGGVFGP